MLSKIKYFQKSLKIGIKWKLIWLTETNIILIYHRNTLNHCLCDQRLSTRHWNSRANKLCKIALDMSFSALESSKIGDRCRRGFMLVTTLRCWWLVLYISKVTYVMILSPTNCHHQKRWNPRKGVNDRNLTKNKIKNRIMINIFFRINEKRARLNIKLIICRSRFIIG